MRTPSGSGDAEDAPHPRDALELVRPAIHEAQLRPGDEVTDGARYQNLAWLGERGDASANGHRDAGHLAIVHLTLAGVDAGADRYAERRDGIPDCDRRGNGTRRTLEGGEEPVP